MGKLTAYMLLALLWTIQVALADAPVIWYGANAKWLNSGNKTAGICTTDVNGVQTPYTTNGIVKMSSGVPGAAASGTDFAPATSGSAILKGNGSGGFSSAASGTDYAPATSGTSLLKGSGSGGFSNATSGTDYAPATSGSAILKGNGAGGFSNAAAGTDYVAATSGSAIQKANGSGGLTPATSGTDFSAGTSALATGLLKSTTTTGVLSIAASGTDYAPATSGSSILKGNGAGGFSNAASGTDYAPATSGSSYLKGNGSGGFTNQATPLPIADTTFSTQAISASSIDWSTGSLFTKTLAANTTFTFANQLSGQTIVVRLTNTASNWTVTWPTVKWPGGVTPTMTTGAKSDVYTFVYDGANTYGSSVQNF